jgi:hypothetical protein
VPAAGVPGSSCARVLPAGLLPPAVPTWLPCSSSAAGGVAGVVAPVAPAALPGSSSAAVLPAVGHPGATQADASAIPYGMPIPAVPWGPQGSGGTAAPGAGGSVRRVASSPNMPYGINSSAWQPGTGYGVSTDTAVHTGGVSVLDQGAEGVWGAALQGHELAFMTRRSTVMMTLCLTG